MSLHPGKVDVTKMLKEMVEGNFYWDAPGGGRTSWRTYISAAADAALKAYMETEGGRALDTRVNELIAKRVDYAVQAAHGRLATDEMRVYADSAVKKALEAALGKAAGK